MKCRIHSQEAIGICPYCGRAVCASCDRVPSSGRTACSPACAEALVQGEYAAQLTLRKHVQGARVAAYFLCVSGIAFVAFAIIGYLKEPRLFMPHLLAAVFGVILTIAGVAYHRVAGSRTQRPNQAMERTADRRTLDF
jgi:hypothetical protein